MAKYKPYNYDQMVMIPIILKDQLEPGTLEFAIHAWSIIKSIPLFLNNDTRTTIQAPRLSIPKSC
ncbi:MAG: hypothetical protein ACE5NG_14075 [bacterium]